MHLTNILTAATIALGFPAVVCLADGDLKPLHIGDAAPPVEITHYLKGEPVTKFDEGKVYVVEFWATWCGPCLASMPHISETQEKYKDYGVTFIGISDEVLPTVVKFLCKPDKEGKLWNDKITYTLTTDPDRSAHDSYMSGVGAMGIPTAFIIGKEGKLEWVGHPMGIDEPLESVVKDKWNRDDFAKEFEPQAEKDRAQMASMAAERAKSKPHRDALKKAIEAKDEKAAIAALDALIELNPDSPSPKMQKFMVLLKDLDAPKPAYACGEELAKANWDDPMQLNQLAWYVVDTNGIKSRDLDFALRLASRADELTKEKDPAILDTLARIHHDKGDLKTAVRIQKLAVANSKEGPMGEDIAATLKKYEEELAK